MIRWIAVFLAFWVWLTSASALASEGPPPMLQPSTYVSPSGEYALEVMPSDRLGAGPGVCTLRHDGEVVWSKTLRYTFWEAVVTDDGLVGGYGYLSGLRSFTEDLPLVIALLDRHGEVRVERRLPRRHTGHLDTPPYPLAHGAFVQPDWGQLVVRLSFEPFEPRSEVWHRLDLATGNVVAELSVDEMVGSLRDAHSVIGAQPIAGTPLVLVHWYALDRTQQGYVRMGDAFTLVDVNAAIAVAALSNTSPGQGPSGVHFFDEDAQPTAFIESPTRWKLAFDGRRAFATVEGDVFIFDGQAGTVRRFTPALPEGAQDYLYPMIGPAGELWLHPAGTTTVLRYRLPE